MTTPAIRILGAVHDLDGNPVPVGVCDGTVVILGRHLDTDQAEEFGQLLTHACWDAEDFRRTLAEALVPLAEPVSISLACGHKALLSPGEEHTALFWCTRCKHLRPGEAA